MKWQVIAGISQQINEEAKGYLIRKLEKDASVEMPNLWADFIKDTTTHLHQSQSNIEVASDNKSGGFGCLTQFDELHPDYLENNKPFIEYFLGKYDKRAVDYLQQAKNPLTRRMLQAKINDYRISLVGQISHTEAKLIDGKRHHLAIEAIEKFKIATYDNPEFYSSNLQDSIIAISSLSLLPQEKEQMLINARQALAFAAALGTLKHSPDAILNPNIKAEWKEDLSLEQRIKLEGQANNLIHHQQLLRQHQLSSLIDAHLASLLATGKGIDGIENLLQASFNAGDPRLLQFRTQEALYKQAFIISEQIKRLPFNQGQEILQQIAPKGGDSDYNNKERIYHILTEQFNKQLKLAQTDPAGMVEEMYADEIPKDMPLFQRLLLRKQLQEQKGIPSYDQKYLMNKERDEYSKKIGSKDVNQIQQTTDGIISLRGDDGSGEQYGLEIMDEILRGNGDLECLTQFYAESRLYNRKTASAFIQMIALVNELSVKSQPLFISHETTEFNKEIENNGIFKQWGKDLAKTDIQNETEINQTRQAIKYLAKYYQRTEDLSIAKAVKKATTKLISEVDMRIDSKNLQIPRQVVAQRMIHDLNSDNIEASLVEIQLAIINGSIACDYGTIVAEGNGRNIIDNINDPTGQYTAAAKVRESLQQGKWKLTSDKKSVYYTFPTKDGRYLPVVAKDGNILKFDLLELNNPKALEQQKQRLLQTISEYPQYD
ncbi:hypothetical protein [Candidatus Tisiphia endosymbiont of Hybos culiciformis]|uniref:hypothetical protein n=1 Tax=Candidatus Tisiphia endosymbiont of Hybos culiciformis TaxID=3139331 RepID=UPI003CCB0D61